MTRTRPLLASTIAALLISVSAARAQSTVVSPPGIEGVDGDTLFLPVNSPFPTPGPAGTPDGWRAQEVHPASAFETLVGSGPVTLTGLAWRPDISVDGPISTAWDLTLNLSTTSAQLDALSSTFADNYGAIGFTQVFSGTLPLETDGVPRGEGLPHDFDYYVPFESPYQYDPSRGNLLVEWITPTDLAEAWAWVDADSRTGSFVFDPSSVAEEARFGEPGLFATRFDLVTETSEVLLVTPPGLEEQEGNKAFAEGPTPPGLNGLRVHEVHPASNFAQLIGPHNAITAISWRPDRSVTSPQTVKDDNFELLLSSTNAAPNALSTTFANNIGVDETLVFSGAMDFSTDGTDTQNGARPFDYLVKLETPFVYDPDHGNLLLEMRLGPTATIVGKKGPAFDGHALGDAIQTVAAGDVTASTGTTFSGLTVKEFRFISLDCNDNGVMDVRDANCASAFTIDATLAAARLIKGDADGDGQVRFADFLILSSHFDKPGQYIEGDFDKNGQIEFADFLILADNFGESSASTATLVPEPMGVAPITALILLSVLSRFRHSHRDRRRDSLVRSSRGRGRRR